MGGEEITLEKLREIFNSHGKEAEQMKSRVDKKIYKEIARKIYKEISHRFFNDNGNLLKKVEEDK